MSNSEMASDEGVRSGYIDTLRGVAILGVVAVHFGGSFATPANAWTASFVVGVILNQVFHFAVPLFVFLAGYLSISGSASTKDATLSAYYLRRLVRIALPYLVVSGISLVLFGHLSRLLAMSTTAERVWWLLSHLLFFGVEGTLYFIPLIMQLYLLQPLLKVLPAKISRLSGAKVSEPRAAAALTVAFLTVHVVLGALCFRGVIDYYVWARPNALFWMVYFFAGMQLRVFGLPLPRATRIRAITVLLGIATAAMCWNIARVLDPGLVGTGFTSSMIEWTYVVPLVVICNLTFVAGVSLGMGAGWKPSSAILIRFGRASLSIYLWHIIALYLAAWRNPAVLKVCRDLPEVILIVVFATAWFISAMGIAGQRVRGFFRQFVLILETRGTGLPSR